MEILTGHCSTGRNYQDILPGKAADSPQSQTTRHHQWYCEIYPLEGKTLHLGKRTTSRVAKYFFLENQLSLLWMPCFHPYILHQTSWALALRAGLAHLWELLTAASHLRSQQIRIFSCSHCPWNSFSHFSFFFCNRNYSKHLIKVSNTISHVYSLLHHAIKTLYPIKQLQKCCKTHGSGKKNTHLFASSFLWLHYKTDAAQGNQ